MIDIKDLMSETQALNERRADLSDGEDDDTNELYGSGEDPIDKPTECNEILTSYCSFDETILNQPSQGTTDCHYVQSTCPQGQKCLSGECVTSVDQCFAGEDSCIDSSGDTQYTKCENEHQLTSFACDNGQCKAETITCSNGADRINFVCENGECVDRPNDCYTEIIDGREICYECNVEKKKKMGSNLCLTLTKH